MVDPRLAGRSASKLLLIDDDTILCDALARAFTKRGFNVRVALTQEAAEELARDDPPDYAVVDLRLQNRSGLEIVSTLIALNATARIVVFSAYGNIATAIEAIKLGATYYLCKPATADDIIVAFHHQAGGGVPVARERPISIKRLEWEHLWRVLRENGGNVSRAARVLSMHRRTLQRKLAKRPVRN
jgi:two-component system response regulator RegA